MNLKQLKELSIEYASFKKKFKKKINDLELIDLNEYYRLKKSGFLDKLVEIMSISKEFIMYYELKELLDKELWEKLESVKS